MNSNEALSGWVFIYNAFTEQWWGTKRESYRNLWNGGGDILKADTFETLRELISRTGGEPAKLEELVNQYK